MRDIRTINCANGQKLESDDFMKRLGDVAYRNLGTLSKVGLFDEGKALIVGDGLRVEASSLMTVNVPSGTLFQRFIDVIPCIQLTDQTVTLEAATGVARIDIIEAQIKVVEDKTDYAQTATVDASGTSISITNEEIKRDIKYYLSARKQTSTTTPTSATSGTLTGTVAIAGTIDLSEKYLLNLSDGEDGSFQEIDCSGATPAATTRVEIISAINAAVGRTMASAGAGSVIILTGNGTGQTSFFTIKPPNTDADKDCLETILGVSSGGVYKYTYEGNNEWFKLAEIDVGTVTTTITTALIRNINKKDSWASGETDVIVQDHIYQPNISVWNVFDDATTYSQWDVTWIDDDQYVSLQNTNLNKHPITEPDWWEIVPKFNEFTKEFHRAKPIMGGLKNIDNYRDADYEQWQFAGYFTKGGKNFEGYKVRLDGTQITGDADLVGIFDVGGTNEYKFLDTLAPDIVGTRTLPDLRGRVLASVDVGGGNREAVGVVQEDAMQQITAGFVANSPRIIVSSSGAFSLSDSGATGPNPGTNTRGGQIDFDSANSISPNTAKTDPVETRMANYSVGIPHIVVLLEV